MAHECRGIVERLHQRSHRPGVAKDGKRLGGIHPLHVIIGGCKHLRDGREPARVGADLPERLRQIDDLQLALHHVVE